jgi:glutathione S-transferase
MLTVVFLSSFVPFSAANSHGPLAVVKKLGMDDVELVSAYGQTRTPEFMAMNPCHCAPMVELEDGSAIWESNTVMRYLCAVSPKGDSLYPTDMKKRALVDMALDWRQTKLYPCFPAIGYIVFGFPVTDDDAKAKFKELMTEHFKVLSDTFLKDTDFIYSDTPTIADLSVAPPLAFIKARDKFWEAVPDKVKDYYARVLEAFPEAKEFFDSLADMASGYSGEGADLEPVMD